MKKNKPEILFESDDVLVVNKVAGWLSIPDRHQAEKLNLLHWLQAKYDRIIPVHRLDKETSGVICFARNEAAHRHLSLQFEQHQVQKIYHALLHGQLHQQEGVIIAGIAPHPSRPGRMICSKQGKRAETKFQVLEVFQQFTLVAVEIKTGRTHQIRVHFQSLGYPLAVDAFYGARTGFFLSEIKGQAYHKTKGQEERPLLGRLSLHAQSLSFLSPNQDHKITIEAPLPKDLGATLKQLRRWGK